MTSRRRRLSPRQSSPPTRLTTTSCFFFIHPVLNPPPVSSGDSRTIPLLRPDPLPHLFNASLHPILILISSTVACSGNFIRRRWLVHTRLQSHFIPACLIRLKGIRSASLDSCLLLVSFGFFGFRFDWGVQAISSSATFRMAIARPLRLLGFGVSSV